jgi:hypothetical protein
MKMTKGKRISLFCMLIVIGLFFQIPMSVGCRCHWGAFSSNMIYGAMLVDGWVLLRLIIAMFRHKFMEQCLTGAALVATSPIWIPLIFKLTLAVYFLPQGQPVRSLFH